MVSHREVEAQLKRIGVEIRVWGRAEMNELANILLPTEQIIQCLNGRYAGGFAMICATDQRVFIIDKKPLFLTIEDIRYDMISEINFSRRLLNSTVVISSMNKQVFFTTFRQNRLRELTSYIQYRVIELRQTGSMSHMNPAVINEQSQLVPQRISTQSNPVMATNQSGYIVDSPYTQAANQFGRNPYSKMPLMTRNRWSPFSSKK